MHAIFSIFVSLIFALTAIFIVINLIQLAKSGKEARKGFPENINLQNNFPNQSFDMHTQMHNDAMRMHNEAVHMHNQTHQNFVDHTIHMNHFNNMHMM